MAAVAEQTTAFALAEKSKLIKSLRRFDMVFFTVCAFVGLDTLGTVASNGPQGFFWLVVLAVVFVAPYMLADGRGRERVHDGGRPVRVGEARLRAPARRHRRDPLLGHEPAVGRRLARVHLDRRVARERLRDRARRRSATTSSSSSFIWISIGVAIVSLRYGKWIPNARRVPAHHRARLLLDHRRHLRRRSTASHGFSGHDARRRRSAVFLGLVPVLLFNYVGFELQNGAAEEMETRSTTSRSRSSRAAILGVLLYVIPILGDPARAAAAKAITGIGGFIDAVTKVFSVYGGAAHTLLVLMTICFVGTLVTSGAVWMIGSDRIQAVAAYDGAFFPWFGVFNRKLGTPVRVNVHVGRRLDRSSASRRSRSSTVGADTTFQIVLDIAISTTLHLVHLDLPGGAEAPLHPPGRAATVRVPFGKTGIWIGDAADHVLGRARLVGGGLPGHAREALRRRVRLQGHLGRLAREVRGLHARDARDDRRVRSRRLLRRRSRARDVVALEGDRPQPTALPDDLPPAP